jgi:hypothetical protein
MANAIINRVDADDLHDWLYTQGIDQLTELSNLASQSAYFLTATDSEGEPTEKCREAISHHNDLNRFLSVLNLVRNQISIMEN